MLKCIKYCLTDSFPIGSEYPILYILERVCIPANDNISLC